MYDFMQNLEHFEEAIIFSEGGINPFLLESRFESFQSLN